MAKVIIEDNPEKAVKPKKGAGVNTVAEVAMNNFDKVQALTASLNKHYGKKVVRSGDDIPKIYKIPYREPALDYVTDGGVAIGRFFEGLGVEHTGKTRNSLRALSQFQKYCFGCHTDNVLKAVWEVDKKTGAPKTTSCKCSNCDNAVTKVNVFVDIEGTTDPKFMKLFGIDINGVIYVRVNLPSQAVDIVDAYLREPMIGLIILDSVGSMGSDTEVEKAMEDIKMNQNALFLNRATRKWQMALNANTNETGEENGTTLYVINQSYQTLDLHSRDVAQGGRGLRHGKAQSIKLQMVTKNTDPKTFEVKGVHLRAVNEKNKTGMPYRRMEYYLNLDPTHPDIKYCHTNVSMQYVDLAIMYGLLEQKGGWYYLGEQKWQGKASIVDSLPEDIKKAVDKILYEE